jgi:hypothetical protein
VNWKSTLPNNVAPTLTKAYPDHWVTDIFDLFVELTGTHFSYNAVVLVNGAPAQTFVFSPTDLYFDLPPSDLTTAGTNLQLSVFNGSPGGGPSQPVAFPVKTADFSLYMANSSISVKAGQSASTNVFAYPNPAFQDGVSLACSGLPANLTCSFTPGRILTDSYAVVTFTAKPLSSASTSLSASLSLCLPVVGLLWIGLARWAPRRHSRRIRSLASLVVIGLLLGCGGGGGQPSGTSSNAPSPTGSGGSTTGSGGSSGGSTTSSGTGTYSVTITGTSGSIQHSVTMTVTVTS